MLLFLTKRQKIIIRNNIFYLLKDLFLFRQRIIVHILRTIVLLLLQLIINYGNSQRSKNTIISTDELHDQTVQFKQNNKKYANNLDISEKSSNFAPQIGFILYAIQIH